MRFLIDAQLPPALAHFLKDSGHEAEHVYEVGLTDASDDAIWLAAAKKQSILITKDEDFSIRLPLDPKVSILWIRIGNCSNRILVEKLKPLLQGIIERLQQGERLIEII